MDRHHLRSSRGGEAGGSEKEHCRNLVRLERPARKRRGRVLCVHGPTAFIEFAPQRLGGDPTNHIHTIYRDPTNEYGAKWWKP